MDQIPLDIEPGDIVWFELTHPIKYSDGNGGEEHQYLVRIQVDAIGDLGISGRGSSNQGGIVPIKSGDYDRLGGTPEEKPEFFPWSSVQRMTLLYKFADYEAIWDQESRSQ